MSSTVLIDFRICFYFLLVCACVLRMCFQCFMLPASGPTIFQRTTAFVDYNLPCIIAYLSRHKTCTLIFCFFFYVLIFLLFCVCVQHEYHRQQQQYFYPREEDPRSSHHMGSMDVPFSAQYGMGGMDPQGL